MYFITLCENSSISICLNSTLSMHGHMLARGIDLVVVLYLGPFTRTSFFLLQFGLFEVPPLACINSVRAIALHAILARQCEEDKTKNF